MPIIAPVDPHLPEGSVELLVFDAGGRRLAIPALDVREVLRAVAIAPLPKAPEIVEGVINFRGALVPVLDVRQRFRLPPIPLAPEQHFIVARAGPRPVAIRVDRALDLTVVRDEVIEAAERVVPGSEHVAGIAKLPDGLLVIQDLERFLSLEEGDRVDAALAAPAGRPDSRGKSR